MNKKVKYKSEFKSFLFTLICLSIAVQVHSQKPNILWLTCEDISPMLSMYGDSTAKTPNLDKLASESLIFTEAYATVGVCAPARSSIITGQYPVSIGTHQMRAGKDYTGWGSRVYEGKSKGIDINGNPVPLYAVVTPPETKCFTEYLRADGYFCTNNFKADCQFAIPVTAFDENSNSAHWKHRKKNQAFFSIFNHEVTHESRVWKNKEMPMTVNPALVPLPPYFPDTKTVRKDVARVYSNIELLDQQIGAKIAELEAAGILDNTIIFFFSDHGGPLPRGKRAHYISGLRVPMMVRIPKQLQKKYIDDMVSFVDLAPTVLSLAGIKIPKHMQGQAFLGDQKSSKPRKYIYGSGDRFDEFSDRIRSVISKDFVYVKNYHPELPAYKEVTYRKSIDMMNEMITMNSENKLNEDQAYWFRENKSNEEFYVRASDPYQLNNLDSNKKHNKQKKQMRKALKKWQKTIDDKGAIPESDYVAQMWNKGIQPTTIEPTIQDIKGNITLFCTTDGSSIAYIISDVDIEPNLDSGWNVYSKPFSISDGEKLYVMGTRIGFKDSAIVRR